MESCKKKCLNVSQKVKKRSYLLKSQESAQQCWEFKIVLQIRKSAEKVPGQSGHAYFLAQYTCGRGYLNTEPGLRARTPVTTYTKNSLSQKSREAVKGQQWE